MSPASHAIGASYQDASGATVSAGSNISFGQVTSVRRSSETVLGFPGVSSEYVVPKKQLNLGGQQVTLNLQAAQALVTQPTQNRASNTSRPGSAAPSRSPAPAIPRRNLGPKPVVAVFNIQDTREVRGLSVQEKTDLTAYLITLLTNTSRYASVPKADLKAALSAQKAQSYDACYDESCQIEIGKEVAAEKSLSTRISKFGQKCIVAMTKYDLRKSATESAVQDRVRCDPDSLIAAFEKLVPQLAASQAPTVPQSNGTMF